MEIPHFLLLGYGNPLQTIFTEIDGADILRSHSHNLQPASAALLPYIQKLEPGCPSNSIPQDSTVKMVLFYPICEIPVTVKITTGQNAMMVICYTLGVNRKRKNSN